MEQLSLDQRVAAIACEEVYKFDKGDYPATTLPYGYYQVYNNGRNMAAWKSDVLDRGRGTYIVAFKGTNPKSFLDLNADLNLIIGREGRDPLFRFTEGTFQSFFQSANTYRNRMILTGHSLGGTLASRMNMRVAGGNLLTYLFNAPKSYNRGDIAIDLFNDPIGRMKKILGSPEVTIYAEKGKIYDAHFISNFTNPVTTEFAVE